MIGAAKGGKVRACSFSIGMNLSTGNLIARKSFGFTRNVVATAFVFQNPRKNDTLPHLAILYITITKKINKALSVNSTSSLRFNASR